ncbi:Filamentation induced by cAMP protein Fic [Planktothrix sp. PCC 11201]|uniref:Fic family protein n=1 Tax=Planktothrix sp. PCC 11201 TaxID=1729650 RepID=UPI0009103E00|nr:Fic family protein [Planktothrix sp. PCC 11201]SKB15045.1 Filamentation induced by cAMP protein Fic [Planktothrix sp. PCC 11201]
MSSPTEFIESVDLMEPMLPAVGNQLLDDLATELIALSRALNAQVTPSVALSMGELVRSMNCYYSNLIEGHNTHPRDIDRALANDFSQEPKKRSLQLEAKAHIEVQRMIDKGEEKDCAVVTTDYLIWIHREFCQRLSSDLLYVEDPQGKKRVEVKPGELRTGDVSVGAHVPISAPAIPRFLGRFEEAYNPKRLSLIQQVIAVAASHHRLLWIHPFFDGNGRVTRLFSHAFLRQIGVGSSLWSVSRGLARNANLYRDLLMAADKRRWNDLDGRGNLTEAGLQKFCKFFLETCIDQVTFMRSLLEPSQLLNRIELYVEEEIRAGRLLERSFPLLKEALYSGSFERGQAATITGYKERQARTVLKKLVEAGLLVSDTPKGAVRLGFPTDVVERYFPKLYVPTI